MDIKGKFEYAETKTQKTALEKDIFTAGSASFPPIKPVGESGYFNKNGDILFALKPLNSKQKIKQNFIDQLRELKFFDESIIAYIDKTDSERLVKKEYFDVFYCKVLNATYRHTSNETHYRKTGEYSMTASTSSDETTYDISPKYESYTKFSTSYDSKSVKRLVYCSQLDKAFYSTDAIDQSRLAEGDELRGLAYYESNNFRSLAAKTVGAESVEDLTLIQVLLFPIWKIEFRFEGENYSAYLSDISGKMILKQGDTFPKAALPVLLTDRVNTRRRRRKLAYNLQMFFCGLFLIVNIFAGMVYAIMALMHSLRHESWTWFFIHVGIFSAAATFSALGVIKFTKSEGNKNAYLRSAAVPFIFTLFSLLLIAAGITLRYLYPA